MMYSSALNDISKANCFKKGRHDEIIVPDAKHDSRLDINFRSLQRKEKDEGIQPKLVLLLHFIFSLAFPRICLINTSLLS